MDVNGNDNTPEWGYCEHPGCHEVAEPIWLSGEFPDDPDFLFCYRHIGSKMNALIVLLRSVIASPRWISMGALQNVAELHVDRECFERAAQEAYDETLT